MKIDVFCHLFPPTFYERMVNSSNPQGTYLQRRVANIPVLVDLDLRFRIMDQYPDYRQIVSMASPPMEGFGGPNESPDIARHANDGMAELVAQYPDRFVGFLASLPMNNMDACLKEVDRAMLELGAPGVQVFTNVNGRPLDEPEFRPLFQRMAELDRAVWIHPARGSSFSDYPTEKKSKYEIWFIFGWPYDSTVAMTRLVFSGIFEELPHLKIITHHMGGMVPYYEGRIGYGLGVVGSRSPKEEADLVKHNLTRPPIDYFRMFYADTAHFGAVAPLECGLAFFGIDHILFSTDMPFDPEKGPGFIRETIRAIEAMSIAPSDREKIYEGNARRLLKLPG